jgi:hypothetical protein
MGDRWCCFLPTGQSGGYYDGSYIDVTDIQPDGEGAIALKALQQAVAAINQNKPTLLL